MLQDVPLRREPKPPEGGCVFQFTFTLHGGEMKKSFIATLALICCMVWSVPAFAVDFEYGGYWRTRAYTMNGFTGDGDDESLDMSKVDARGRLWTKHIINEETSWTNRIEFNVIWGDEDNGGGIATDGTDYIRFKHSYMDYDTTVFNTDMHLRMGLQGFTVANGMLFDDDFAGLILSHEGSTATHRFIWMKVFEGSTLSGEYEEDLEDLDVDFLGLSSTFNFMNDALALNAYVFYLTSDDGREWSATTGNQEISVYYLGADIKYTLDSGNIWGVLLYEGGSADVVNSDVEYDMKAYIAALGGEMNLGKVGIHGQVFYASGDDDLSDTDVTGFYVPRGQSYYWSEIMGMGVFDYTASSGSPADTISNVVAGNLGISYEVSQDLSLTGDIWHARHADTNVLVTEKTLGTEIDLRADYKINEDLNLVVVGAYLFADDATTMGADDASDVYEIGMQLSFSFSTL